MRRPYARQDDRVRLQELVHQRDIFPPGGIHFELRDFPAELRRDVGQGDEFVSTADGIGELHADGSEIELSGLYPREDTLAPFALFVQTHDCDAADWTMQDRVLLWESRDQVL